MIERGQARECDMVVAFLQAEISSSRYSQFIRPNLESNKLAQADLIDRPDLQNEFHNKIRRELLQYRGYLTKSHLFAGFPPDVVWRSVEVEPQDHRMLYCANDTSANSWVEVSEGTRSIEHIARRIPRLEKAESPRERETAGRVREIQKDLNNGELMPRLIAVEGDNGRLVLVEGHSRAVAYLNLNWQSNIPMLIGRSERIKEWVYY
jgi:hypothetical protein